MFFSYFTWLCGAACSPRLAESCCVWPIAPLPLAQGTCPQEKGEQQVGNQQLGMDRSCHKRVASKLLGNRQSR